MGRQGPQRTGKLHPRGGCRVMHAGASVAVLLCLLAGCSPATGEDAPGTYILHQRNVADTLWVREDSTWTHRYVREGTAPIITRGRWQFEEMMNRPSLKFHEFPFRSYFHYIPDPARRGTWPAFIERTATGAVVLPVNNDLRMRYHRISTRMLGSGGRP